jgi:hypothetical protein
LMESAYEMNTWIDGHIGDTSTRDDKGLEHKMPRLENIVRTGPLVPVPPLYL